MLAHNQGRQFNAAALAKSLGISGATVHRYLDLMVDLLLVRCLVSWRSNLGRRLVKAPKTYLRDSGICHALPGIESPDALLGHPVAGGSWEGLAIENIVGRLPAHAAFGYHRTVGGAEVDLVIERGPGRLWAVEIKRGAAPRVSRGLHSACEDLRPERKLVVHGGSDSFSLGRGIEAMPLRALCDELA